MASTSTSRLLARSRSWRTDPHLLLALALSITAVCIELATDPQGMPHLVPPIATNLFLQALAHRVSRRDPPAWLHMARLLAAVAAVFWMSIVASTAGAVTLTMLYIPIVTMAAAMSTRRALVVGAVSLGSSVVLITILRMASAPGLAEAAGVDPSAGMFQRGVTMMATMLVLAIGTRRTISTLERAIARSRSATARTRRQARQMSAVEEVGRLLAVSGPTKPALEAVIDVLVGRFGYHFVSIYTVDGPNMRLGAQRGYTSVIETFDGSIGVVGRVMRTRQAVLVPDVRLDPDYAEADARVRSEVSVPLLSGDDVIGVLNTESPESRPLDASDRDTLVLVADRIASALALAAERRALEERAAMFGRLVRFGSAINASLAGAAVREAIVAGCGEVFDASSVALVLRDGVTGEDRMVALHGGDDRFIGSRILPGEGMSGAAMAERQIVLDNEMPRHAFPRTVQASRIPDVIVAAGVPLIHDERIVGSISIIRYDLARPFTPLELETMALVASQVATALVNADLHEQVADAAIRDPLTGLWNRRQLDVSLALLFAGRERFDPELRRPVAAILFDLDHFGAFNKRHGHGTGDKVLREFGLILADRLRSSDLVARYGGEEFIAVLDGATIEEAARIADEIRLALEAIRFQGADGDILRATVSAGCASLGPNVASFGTLLELADVGLQMAKRGGRNQVVAA